MHKILQDVSFETSKKKKKKSNLCNRDWLTCVLACWRIMYAPYCEMGYLNNSKYYKVSQKTFSSDSCIAFKWANITSTKPSHFYMHFSFPENKKTHNIKTKLVTSCHLLGTPQSNEYSQIQQPSNKSFVHLCHFGSCRFVVLINLILSTNYLTNSSIVHS